MHLDQTFALIEDAAVFESLPHVLSRLSLRSLRLSDLESFYRYRSDPVVARYQGWEPMTVSAAADFLASECGRLTHVPGTWRQLAIADLATDILIGDMGIWLSEDSRSAEVGLNITPSAQGRGFATESLRGLVDLLFVSTSVVELEANTDSRNAACVAALRRAGFDHIKTRQAEYKGETCTELVFLMRKSGGLARAQAGSASRVL